MNTHTKKDNARSVLSARDAKKRPCKTLKKEEYARHSAGVASIRPCGLLSQKHQKKKHGATKVQYFVKFVL